ncbi:unnamed protein product, partial [Prorocentrum cordatum]
ARVHSSARRAAPRLRGVGQSSASGPSARSARAARFPTGKMRAWFAHGFFPIGKDLLVRMTHWPATTRVPVRDLYPDPEPLADVVVPPALRPRNLGTSL